MQKLEAEAMENGVYLFVPRLTLSYMSQAYLLGMPPSYCGFTSTINQKKHAPQACTQTKAMEPVQACTQAHVMEPVLTLVLPLSRCDKIYVTVKLTNHTPYVKVFHLNLDKWFQSVINRRDTKKSKLRS